MLTMRNLKILQINTDRVRTAYDAAIATADRLKVDLVFMQEPNKLRVSNSNFIRDEKSDVAVYLRNKNAGIKKYITREGMVKLFFKDFVIYNCYISPNAEKFTFERYIDALMYDIRNEKLNKVILGDINAKSPLWGSTKADARGEYIADWMASTNLVVNNVGNTPTFVRGESSSIIDVTLSSDTFAGKITDWMVLEEETFSLHRYISFGITCNHHFGKMEERSVFTMDKALFSVTLSLIANNTEDDCTALIDKIKHAQNFSTSVRVLKREQPYWWNDEIEEMRKECNKSRRKLARVKKARQELEIAAAVTEHKEAIRAYKKAIRNSKNEHWRAVCDDLERDIWGLGYQIVVKQFKCPNPVYNIDMETKIELAMSMFPQKADHVGHSRPCKVDQPFTLEELQTAVGKLKSGKAPGPDGIKPETLKEAFKVIPSLMLRIFNEVLNQQEIPTKWKIATLALIPKGSQTDASPKYRTICLLDAIGKLFEHLVKNRLETEMEARNALSNRQFGFRKNSSTTDAVKWVTSCLGDRNAVWSVVITVDVENAFNTATWSIVIERLREMGISASLINLVESYFRTRQITIGKTPIQLSQGVPQGSVLGPTLWNALYNTVLELELPENCYTVAYADDLALIVKASSSEKLVEKANFSLDKIHRWMETNQLKLAPAKTEALVVRGSRRKVDVSFVLDGVTIIPTRKLKYLGIWLDSELSYKEHLKQAVMKGERVATALSRLTPNISALGSRKRTILFGAVQSVLLYGAPVWVRAMDVAKNREGYKRLQRKMLLRVASAYRTTSSEALCTITGALPLDLVARERSQIYEAKKSGIEGQTATAIRAESMRAWQTRWEENVETAQWTKVLIPQLAPWVECQFRSLNYHLTQFLTGHGSFRTYTFWIGKSPDDKCVYCGQTDTAAHAVLECERWIGSRTFLERELGTVLTANSIIQVMMENASSWKLVSKYISTVIIERELKERNEQI